MSINKTVDNILNRIHILASSDSKAVLQNQSFPSLHLLESDGLDVFRVYIVALYFNMTISINISLFPYGYLF